MKVLLENMKRELNQSNIEKNTITNSLNEEFTKKDCLVDFIKRLADKIEKPFAKIVEDTLKTIDYTDDFHKKYLELIKLLEAKRVDELVKDQRTELEMKIKTLKAENRKYLLAVRSTRIEQDIMSQKLIESQREAQGAGYLPMIICLAEEIEKR